MSSRIKKIISLALLCILCIPAIGQDKAFKKALKNGKTANGYYHADLSKTPYTREHLSKYATSKGYIIKNMKEGTVMQFGEYYDAVVSLDFLPVAEHAALNASIGQQTATQNSNLSDETSDLLVNKILREATIQNNDIITIKTEFTSRYDIKTSKYKYRNSQGKVVTHLYDNDDFTRAGNACGMLCISFTQEDNTNCEPRRHIQTAKFTSYANLEKIIIQKLYDNNAAFSSTGEAYVFQQSGKFKKVGNIRWTGSCVNGQLNGRGMGYFLNGSRVNCFVGNFISGNPSRECRYYSLEATDILNNYLYYYATTNTHTFYDGMARCDIKTVRRQRGGFYNYTDSTSRTSYIDDSYNIRIDNIKDIHFNIDKYSPTNIIKEFENGYLTLGFKSSRLKTEIEFYVDKNGNIVKVTEKTESVLCSLLDDQAAKYDKYLSKVINPNDITKPQATLKNRYNFILNEESELIRLYQILDWEEQYKAVVDRYKANNPIKSKKIELTEKTIAMLLTITSDIEKGKKGWEESLMHTANNAVTGLYEKVGFLGLSTIRKQLHASEFISQPTVFEEHNNNVKKTIEEIGTSGYGPSNYKSTITVIDDAYTDFISWYGPISLKAMAIYDKRSEADANAYSQELKAEEAKREEYRQQYNGMDKTPDISSSSNSKSDRNDYNEKSESKSNGTDSKKMLSCKVKIKLPDDTYYQGGNVECWIHKGRWSDEGGYVKCWVDGDGNCTISWEEKRGDYIYEILNICEFGKCYNVKGVELKNGGNYTLSAEAN